MRHYYRPYKYLKGILQLYGSKFENFDEIDQIFERYKSPQIIQGEIDILSNLIYNI